MKQITAIRKGTYYLFFLIMGMGFLFTGCEKKVKIGTSFPRSTPEEQGISSEAILNFIDDVESRPGIELHSLMIVRHSKVVAEGWWQPYASDLKHTLYSTSKSFTSTAIGFAVHEGLLSVDDKVVSFFPDKLPDTVSQNLADMKVKDLLTMSAGQDPEPTFSRLLPSDDWVKAFLSHPVVNVPGSVFKYNSSATYMLSAIVTKVTGQTVLEYLKPRLFEPLKITGMDWEVDPSGINVGGWGLRLKTEDMAKFGQLFLQKGKWNGEQVVPEAWVDEATSKQILQHPVLDDNARSKSDWLQGYGYKFWRSRHNSYRADGAYGQLILVLPEKDAVIAVTAEVDDMQEELNLVWEFLLDGMKEEKLPENKEAQEKLSKRLANLSLPVPEGDDRPILEERISGNKYLFESEGKKETYTFDFNDHVCNVSYTTNEDTNYQFSFGEDEWITGETDRPGISLLPPSGKVMNEMLPYKVAGAYRWQEDRSIVLTLRYIESPHSQYFQFSFDEEEVILKIWESRPGSDRVVTMKGKLVA